MLKVNNICSGYGDIQIVNGISIDVEDQMIVAIVGSNGVGKSTLLKTITGIIPTTSGDTVFNDERITGLMTNQILERGISLVPEGRQLFNFMSVEENLYVGSCTKANRKNRAENIAKMYEIFPRLKERCKQLAGTLSGGEQQMLATARSLMSNPKLLIMDEPSWGLAPILVAELFETIKNVRQSGTAVLLVEQNVYKALQICDRAYVIEHGTVVLEGEGKDLLINDDLKKAYLGI
jgi:branched-chain amino acid transport system ATP-binding protein